jgi:hypothetical protein
MEAAAAMRVGAARRMETMPPCVTIGSAIIDPQAVSVSIACQLLTTAVVPRPIGFIAGDDPPDIAVRCIIPD